MFYLCGTFLHLFTKKGYIENGYVKLAVLKLFYYFIIYYFKNNAENYLLLEKMASLGELVFSKAV